MDYKSSGVDIDLADKFVDRIKSMVKLTHNENVVSGVGGFASLYKMDEDRFLAASTDGVGTKIKLAIETGIHDTIGIDLVAMCVNDLVCTGARPMFFLDYFATGKLKLEVAEAVLQGITEGCRQGKMALIGGETAEMPGMYQQEDYDLAGFSVGEVYKENLLDGSNVKAGQTLIGIASSGFHSNGFSLVRKVIEKVSDPAQQLQLKKDCLTPTRIYVQFFQDLQKNLGSKVTGLANITGSGFLNIPRLNESLAYQIDAPPSISDLPKFMQTVIELSGLPALDLYKTFNMGVGLVLSTDHPEEAMKYLESKNEKAWVLGKILPTTSDLSAGQIRLGKDLI